MLRCFKALSRSLFIWDLWQRRLILMRKVRCVRSFFIFILWPWLIPLRCRRLIRLPARGGGRYFGSLSRWQTKNQTTASSEWHSSCHCKSHKSHNVHLCCSQQTLQPVLFPTLSRQTWICLVCLNDVVHIPPPPQKNRLFAKIFRGGATCCNKSLLHTMHKSQTPSPWQSSFSQTHNHVFSCCLPPRTEGVSLLAWPWCNIAECSCSEHLPWLEFQSLIRTHCVSHAAEGDPCNSDTDSHTHWLTVLSPQHQGGSMNWVKPYSKVCMLLTFDLQISSMSQCGRDAVIVWKMSADPSSDGELVCADFCEAQSDAAWQCTAVDQCPCVSPGVWLFSSVCPHPAGP